MSKEIPSPYSSHHSGTNWSLSHLSIGCCSRTVKAFLDVVWQTLVFLFLRLTNDLHLVVNPLYSLWWSLLLIVDFETDTPTSWRVFLIWPTVVKGFFFTREIIILSSTTVVFRGLPGLFVLLSSPVRYFFLRMFQTVDLATPNVFAISLISLFWFFSLMMACFTDSDSSLDLILRVDSNRFQMQIAYLKWFLDLLSAPCKLDNEGITHTWPWNSWAANCPITFGPLKMGGTYRNCCVIPTPFTWFGCKYPQIKAGSLQLKHIFNYKSIVVVYRAKKIRIVLISQYLWTWLYTINPHISYLVVVMWKANPKPLCIMGNLATNYFSTCYSPKCNATAPTVWT